MDETPRTSRSRLRAAVVIIAIATAIVALVAAAVAGAWEDDEALLRVLQDGTAHPDDALPATGVSLGVHKDDLPLWLEGLE